MKIICIGRNYREHINELKNAVPTKPVIFIKHKNALLTKRKFLYPEFTAQLHYEAELVFRVSKNGKYISKRKALDYVDAITVGLDLTARDVQEELKAKGLPWELAKSFDHSAVVGQWVPLDQHMDLNNLSFELHKNEQVVQKGHSSDMIFPLEHIIQYVSQYFTLNIGDLIFTGTPAGVGEADVFDEFEGFLQGQSLLQLSIK